MSVSAGARLGPYEVVSLIGEGAMGQVYKARDTRLDRDVAIKTSKVSFDDRFQREARAIAALNHPHICTVHDVGPDYLVMEYVDGESLSERLARGPLSESDAIGLALQIAGALDAAHDRGIVHRDLKPANIRITRDGNVKVLDFGLAKIVAHADSAGETRAGSTTEPGMVLGSPAYMAPEQARSQPVDKRADLWAFGVVLWEMVTGRTPFGGATTSDVLASVLTHEPDWDDIPPRVRPLIRRCLAKDPRQRLRDAGDARLWLEDPPVTSIPAGRPRRWTTWVPVTVVGVIAVVAVAAIAQRPRPAAERAASVRFSLNAAPGASLVDLSRGGAAISPDGSLLVYRASSAASESQLYLHNFDSNTARVLEGTEGAATAFFSPDGQSIAFRAGSRLKRIPAAGGAPVVLCEAAGIGTGDWAADGTILIALDDGIWRVDAASGEKQRVTEVDRAKDEAGHRSPQFLPDGRRYIYLIDHTDVSKRGIYAGSLDRPGEPSFVGRANGKVVYIPAATGRPAAVLYLRDQTLVAHEFDTAAAKLIGEPVALAGPIYVLSGVRGDADFMASASGVLAFRLSDAAVTRRLVWLGPDGARLGEMAEQGQFTSFFLSPDDARLSVDVRTANGLHDVKIYDFGRHVMSVQTTNPANDFLGVWSPDSRRMVFGSSRTGVSQLYLTTVGGGSAEEQITTGPAPKYPLQWTDDGRYLLFRHQIRADGGSDLWAMAVDGDRTPFPVVEGGSNKFTGQISPDGKWIAYQSTGADSTEVYVQSFPTTAFKVQVSNKGGRWPKWVATGPKLELFYVSAADQMTAVELIPRGNELEPGTPRELFRVAFQTGTTYPYDVTRDGKRLLVTESVGSEARPIEVITNWQSRLKP